MKKCLLVFTLCLTGCTLQEIIAIEKDPSILLEQKVEMEHGEVEGTLIGKRKLGDKQICYYSIEKNNISGFSLVRDSCPLILHHKR